MAVNGISSGTDTSALADASVTKKTGNNGLGKDDFMKLLTAQLKNQDPNNPTDTKELVTQLSQLTSVEQLQQMSSKLDTLTAATNSSAANSSSALIGKTVRGVADTARLGATGGTSSAVNLSANADKVTVSVVNESGRVVKSLNLGAMKAGNATIEWDGSDDGGNRAAEGKYTFQVSALDAAGNPVDAGQTISGVVTGVYYENGAPELDLSGTRIPLSNLTSISQTAVSTGSK